MTNGEKIKEIFPNIIKYGNILIDDTGALQKNILFDDSWWNAEYKEPTDDLSSELEKNSKKLEKNFGELDCISRKAVIDELKRYFHDEYYQRTSIQDCRDCFIEDVLNHLPSVTPQEPKIVTIAEIKYDKGKLKELVNKAVLTVTPQEPTALPSVTPIRPKGHWINKSQRSGCGILFVASECTCCGKKTPFNCDEFLYRYCPNCGADMREVEE